MQEGSQSFAVASGAAFRGGCCNALPEMIVLVQDVFRICPRCGHKGTRQIRNLFLGSRGAQPMKTCRKQSSRILFGFSGAPVILKMR